MQTKVGNHTDNGKENKTVCARVLKLNRYLYLLETFSWPSVSMKYLYPCLPTLYQPEILSMQISLSQTNVGPTYLLPDKLFSLSASNVNTTLVFAYPSSCLSMCLCVCASVCLFMCVCVSACLRVCLSEE